MTAGDDGCLRYWKRAITGNYEEFAEVEYPGSEYLTASLSHVIFYPQLTSA